MNLRIEHLAKSYGLKIQGYFDLFELKLQGKLSLVAGDLNLRPSGYGPVLENKLQ
jgi:hypothetical protein